MIEIEDEASLRQAVGRGLNLFLGAGFSKLATGDLGVLPLGSEFEAELREKFADVPIADGLDLSTVSTILKSSRKFAFREFCTARYTVTSYEQIYTSIFRMNLKNVFTTNIDNLIPTLVDNEDERYLHDVFIAGSSPGDSRGINYFALHGCVDHAHRDYVFGTTEIASAYGDDPQLWHYFAQMLTTMPTLFWGYSVRDSGTLRAIHSATRPDKIGSQNRWILLRRDEKVNEAYYRALDLRPIYGDTKELLEYLSSLPKQESQVTEGSAFAAHEFPEYQLPGTSSVPVREASLFFEGMEPSWYDIYQKIPAYTEHFNRIQDLIAGETNVLVQGVAASGKSTLLRMLASANRDASDSVLFISGYMDDSKARILKEIIGERSVKIFWDNMFDTTDAVSIVMGIPNAQVIGADRDYVFQFGYHRLDLENIKVYDCSDLSGVDIQRVIEKIPEALRKQSGAREVEASREPVSIFDVIERVSKTSNLKTRVRKIFSDLDGEDNIYKELFVLISYFHNARVPASFDAVSSYCGLHGIAVLDVYAVLARLGGLVKEYEGAFSDADQDFFSVRSQIFAESCIETCPPHLLKVVISTVLKEISIVKIPYYSVFQRGAFRNEIFVRAFPNWSEGLELYELMVELALTDRPKPYIKQQCALYLAQKRQFAAAFAMIDDAVRMSGGRIPTIRHTQARIKFEANIEIEDDEDGYVRGSLFESLRELEDCRNRDRRKQRHSEYFAKFALQLDDRYNDDETLELVTKAAGWLNEEVGRPGFSRRIARLRQEVLARLATN